MQVRLVCPDSVAHVEEDDGDEDDIENETNEQVCSFVVLVDLQVIIINYFAFKN